MDARRRLEIFYSSRMLSREEGTTFFFARVPSKISAAEVYGRIIDMGHVSCRKESSQIGRRKLKVLVPWVGKVQYRLSIPRRGARGGYGPRPNPCP
jgi:hypothetical protein